MYDVSNFFLSTIGIYVIQDIFLQNSQTSRYFLYKEQPYFTLWWKID